MLRTQLTERERLAFLALAVTQHDVKAQSDFVHPGDSQTSACLIVGGLAAQVDQSISGARQITNFYLAGEIADLHGLIVPSSSAALCAITAVKVLRVRHTHIRSLVFSFPGIGEALWRHMVCDAAIASEWVVNVGSRSGKTRIAHLFCEIAVRSGRVAGNTFEFDFPVTQTNLAEASGLSTVHTNRCLQGLRREGLLQFSGNSVNVVDWTALQASADFDDAYLNTQPPVRFAALD